MPDLRIQTAKDNGDWPTDHDYKKITESRAKQDPNLLKCFNKEFKKEFNRPSVYENSRSQDC